MPVPEKALKMELRQALKWLDQADAAMFHFVLDAADGEQENLRVEAVGKIRDAVKAVEALAASFGFDLQ